MSRQKTHHTKQFKLDAINYRQEHPCDYMSPNDFEKLFERVSSLPAA